VVVGDLSSEADNARCVEEAVRTLGGLDTVVNNIALSGGGGSPTTVDLEVWERVMAVNVRAAILTARHAIPHLKRAGGGSIINVSSVAATRALGAGAYAASKAAIQALARDWALIHGRDHIRANCIVVGHAHTPMGSTDEAGASAVAWPACSALRESRGTSRGRPCFSHPMKAGGLPASIFRWTLVPPQRPRWAFTCLTGQAGRKANWARQYPRPLRAPLRSHSRKPARRKTARPARYPRACPGGAWE
jgi:NAD(P)-dependent dehydrogenase (short-subunit alcohol dehydrogenase family)